MSEKVVLKGPDNQDEYQQYNSYGSLLAASMRKSYKQLYEMIEDELPARYLGAWFETYDVNCTQVFELVITEKERLVKLCGALDFKKIDIYRLFIKAEYDKESGFKLIDQASLTIQEFVDLYNTTESQSLGSRIEAIHKFIAITHSCINP